MAFTWLLHITSSSFTPILFVISAINFSKLFSVILWEYWHSNFQFCVEVKPTNYYSPVTTSAVSSLDIKETILVWDIVLDKF